MFEHFSAHCNASCPFPPNAFDCRECTASVEIKPMTPTSVFPKEYKKTPCPWCPGDLPRRRIGGCIGGPRLQRFAGLLNEKGFCGLSSLRHRLLQELPSPGTPRSRRQRELERRKEEVRTDSPKKGSLVGWRPSLVGYLSKEGIWTWEEPPLCFGFFRVGALRESTEVHTRSNTRTQRNTLEFT